MARAHFQAEWQAKGVITSAGNQDNLVPQKATMEWQFRAPKPDAIALLDAKCIKCLQAAATATGCLVSAVSFGHKMDCIVTKMGKIMDF